MADIKNQVEVMLAYGHKTIQIRVRAGPGRWRDDTGIRPLCFN